jgi:hypothetical protein
MGLNTFRAGTQIQIVAAGRDVQVHCIRLDQVGIAVETLRHRFSVFFARARKNKYVFIVTIHPVGMLPPPRIPHGGPNPLNPQ